jgi:hypothetical protein
VTGRRLGRSLSALAILASAACSKEVTGFQPGVEPWDDPAAAPAEWPPLPATPGTVALVTGDRLATGTIPSYYWAHGRVRLDASPAQVWAAIQWQPGVLLAIYPDDQCDCVPTNAVEPGYAVSFSLREIPRGNALYQANWFRVDWRAEATRDAAQAIQRINVKAQKVDGTSYIELMRQSIVATASPGGGTELEVVRHINARDESQVTAGDWIELWVQGLDAQLKGAPLVPLTRCFP